MLLGSEVGEIRLSLSVPGREFFVYLIMLGMSPVTPITFMTHSPRHLAGSQNLRPRHSESIYIRENKDIQASRVALESLP
jgi:hypothetical protein